MKSRIPKRQSRASDVVAFIDHCCAAVDNSIPLLRTLFLAAGLAGALLRTGVVADFLFLTGLFLQFSIWFQNWWLRKPG
ncbi:hypothetical protein [Massilia sp. ST3]|uniref:hypothetical protein n=1 Tax=Massilia sp. ST3 TaxID=2824903 RepID=UPI001B82BB66|nr:hypothetical protein [Massilia sp. ST3]MBQ5948560.1 hypothetical protein [Massilia sp. ST3]